MEKEKESLKRAQNVRGGHIKTFKNAFIKIFTVLNVISAVLMASAFDGRHEKRAILIFAFNLIWCVLVARANADK